MFGPKYHLPAELCLMIFQNSHVLSFYDYCRFLGVNKEWQSFMTTNKDCLEAMFLPNLDNEGQAVAFPLFEPIDEFGEEGWDGLKLHPIITDSETRRRKIFPLHIPPTRFCRLILSYQVLCVLNKLAKNSKGEESWRSMLFTWPGLSHIDFIIKFLDDDLKYEFEVGGFEAINQRGVTLGDVCDKLRGPSVFDFMSMQDALRMWQLHQHQNRPATDVLSPSYEKHGTGGSITRVCEGTNREEKESRQYLEHFPVKRLQCGLMDRKPAEELKE